MGYAVAWRRCRGCDPNTTTPPRRLLRMDGATIAGADDCFVNGAAVFRTHQCVRGHDATAHRPSMLLESTEMAKDPFCRCHNHDKLQCALLSFQAEHYDEDASGRQSTTNAGFLLPPIQRRKTKALRFECYFSVDRRVEETQPTFLRWRHHDHLGVATKEQSRMNLRREFEKRLRPFDISRHVFIKKHRDSLIQQRESASSMRGNKHRPAWSGENARRDVVGSDPRPDVHTPTP